MATKKKMAVEDDEKDTKKKPGATKKGKKLPPWLVKGKGK
jgi:hypothetical protein